MKKESTQSDCGQVDISEQDVLNAMKAMQGYIDITPADFKEVYRAAYNLAKNRILNSLTAADVMTTSVHSIGLEMDLIETAALLAEKGISGAPVVDHEGKVVGVVSEKDFLAQMGAGQTGSFMQVIAHCLKNKGCVATPMLNRVVRDIMTAPAITAKADTLISKISTLFSEKKINRLPIIGGDGKLAGIVTRSDLVNSYCRLG
ncbi:MAG: CBS domain-containing protein [Desulfobacterales bacterium]|jgi:CBS-domain-containing membrane protein|nr:CBS domain-containing protein [Desulfobacterales bacterium]